VIQLFDQIPDLHKCLGRRANDQCVLILLNAGQRIAAKGEFHFADNFGYVLAIGVLKKNDVDFVIGWLIDDTSRPARPAPPHLILIVLFGVSL
jgi:hypothetical protein